MSPSWETAFPRALKASWVDLVTCVLHPECLYSAEFHILLSVLQGVGMDEPLPAHGYLR